MCDIIRRRKQDITLQVSNESRFNDDTVVFLSGVGSQSHKQGGHGGARMRREWYRTLLLSLARG